MKLQTLALVMIDPPKQSVRVEIDEGGIAELAESIKSVGLLNPLTVKLSDGRYEIVAGHRRFMAANLAGLTQVPCMVLGYEDTNPTAAKLHENLFREDISPAEEAAFYAELLEECGGDTDRVATLVHRSRVTVEGRLLLLTGSAEVLEALATKKISLGVAEELNRLKRPDDIGYYLRWSIEQGATRALVKSWVDGANIQADFNPDGTPPVVEAPTATPEFAAEPTCFICGHTEPRHDVEFWYIHRSCRLIAERNKQEQLEYIYGGRGSGARPGPSEGPSGAPESGPGAGA